MLLLLLVHAWYHGLLIALSHYIYFLLIILRTDLALRQRIQAHLEHLLLLLEVDVLAARAAVQHQQGRVRRHRTLKVHRGAHLAVTTREGTRRVTLLLFFLKEDVTLPLGGGFDVGVVQALVEFEVLLLLLLLLLLEKVVVLLLNLQ